MIKLNERQVKLLNIDNCPICSSKRRKFMGNRGPSTHNITVPFPGTKELNIQLEKISVFDCKTCGLLYCDPVPDYNKEVSSIIYNEEYCTKHRNPEENARKTRHIRYKNMIKRVLKQLDIPVSIKTKHLDIGAGLGDVVVGSKLLGLNSTGLDLSESVCEFARKTNNINMMSCSIFDKSLKKESYDLITLFDIIEHVPNPGEFIERATELLKPNGGLVIDTPNEKGLVMKIGNFLKGRNSTINLSPCADPYHLVGYSNKTIDFLAKKHNLKIIEKNTMNVTLGKAGNIKGNIFVFGINFLDKIGKRFNAGSEFFVILKK
ncbi:MAG: hypothetical protein CL853_05870 [Crocinitomicaceae bacterium]|nr:hypothetical protein [Crocinitomicaceae bacterium]